MGQRFFITQQSIASPASAAWLPPGDWGLAGVSAALTLLPMPLLMAAVAVEACIVEVPLAGGGGAAAQSVHALGSKHIRAPSW